MPGTEWESHTWPPPRGGAGPVLTFGPKPPGGSSVRFSSSRLYFTRRDTPDSHSPLRAGGMGKEFEESLPKTPG